MIKKRYFFWCVILIVVAASVVSLAQDRSASEVRGAKESDLIATLQSNAPKGDKAITCKQLSIYGTEKAVPVLAPLLADEELASWARIALEAIDGSAADAALRESLNNIDGMLLVGAINSIGVRKDAGSVDALIKKLDSSDANVAAAAALALGHIGGEKAALALTKSLTVSSMNVRSAVAEGCILCAEHFLANQNSAEAIKIYDTVQKADVPDQRHLEAIRGAILARKSDGIPMLLEQLQSEDTKRFGVGLRTARELAGRDVTEALAAELGKLQADRRPLLLLAIADRDDSVVLPTVLKAAKNDQKDLRITAIQILIELGDVSCVPILLESAAENDPQLQAAAMETLVRLPGKDVDAALMEELPKAKGKTQRILIELAGQRQISESLAAIVSNLKNDNSEIRKAAVQTITIIGQEKQAVDLVKLLEDTKNSNEQKDIEKALLAICGRNGSVCIPHLQPLIKSGDNDLHMMGLHALAIIGGPEALATVKTAIESASDTVKDEAVRILSTWPNNWPEDSEAGKALLLLATTSEKMSHHVLGLRGYLQYIRGNSKLTNDNKVSEVKYLIEHINRPEEKRQAIAVLGEAPGLSALELLKKLEEEPLVAEEAYSAMIQIAGKNDVSGLSKEQRKEVLQTVIDKSKNEGIRQRAKKVLGGIR